MTKVVSAKSLKNVCNICENRGGLKLTVMSPVPRTVGAPVLRVLIRDTDSRLVPGVVGPFAAYLVNY